MQLQQEIEQVVVAGVGRLVELSEARIGLLRVVDVLWVSVHLGSVVAVVGVAVVPLLEPKSASDFIPKPTARRNQREQGSSEQKL